MFAQEIIVRSYNVISLDIIMSLQHIPGWDLALIPDQLFLTVRLSSSLLIQKAVSAFHCSSVYGMGKRKDVLFYIYSKH